MATTIRPELSEKNPYWIEKHRYYELKHFCLQYPIWRKAYACGKEEDYLWQFTNSLTTRIIFWNQPETTVRIPLQKSGRAGRVAG